MGRKASIREVSTWFWAEHGDKGISGHVVRRQMLYTLVHLHLNRRSRDRQREYGLWSMSWRIGSWRSTAEGSPILVTNMSQRRWWSWWILGLMPVITYWRDRASSSRPRAGIAETLITRWLKERCCRCKGRRFRPYNQGGSAQAQHQELFSSSKVGLSRST